MSINSNSTNIQLDIKRHSFAHLMAAAVGQMFPETQFGVGPVIENGCYYDFVLPRNLVPEDLPLLENHIKDLLKRDLRFKVQELSLEDAIAHFSDAKQPLKVELLENLRDRGTTSMSEEEKADFGDEDYAKLFEKVQHRKLRRVNVGFVITNANGEILFAKKSADKKNRPDLWHIPGGKMEEGENFEQAIRRELKEEFDLDLVKIKSFTNCTWNMFGVEPGNNQDEDTYYFEIEVKGEITLNYENTEYAYFNINNAKNLDGITKPELAIFENINKTNLPAITIYRIVDEKTGEVVFEDLCKGPHVAGVRRVNTQNNENAASNNSPLEGWQPQVDGVFNGMSTSEKFQKYQQLPYNPKLKERAAELRKAGNLSEVLFWDQVKNSKLLDLDFERQKIVGNYIVDFYCPELGLVIEIDGESHDFKGKYDVEREKYLIDLGLKVVHFADIDIKKAMDQVLESLYGMCKKLKETPRQPAVATPHEGNHGSAEDPKININSDKTENNSTLNIQSDIKPQESLNLQNMGFKLDKFSASYWRGDQARGINMQRLYALVFETKDELKAFVTQREEAKKRDHRVLNQTQKYFTISELVGAGLPLFQPNGMLLRKNIQNYLWQLHAKKGYKEVWTPHIAKEELYITSGHAAKFGDELFKVQGKTENFFMKPMNCPHHMQIFADNQFSYRDMPVRYFEHATVYRDEKPGQLSGFTRVRSITQDDGHLFCRVGQIKQEVSTIVAIIREFYDTIGMEASWVSLSVRDMNDLDKYLGGNEVWELAEKSLEEAAIENKLNYKRVEGEAAFYGPKLDFMFKDCMGREWQLATIQCDFNLPEKFDLSFVNEESEKERPVVIHRAISGSVERFLGVIIDNFAGKFPFWLAPEQIRILTINDEVLPFVDKIKEQLDSVVLMQPLKYNEVRYSVDDRMESLGKKIRDCKLDKIPMFIVVGMKDVEESIVSIEYAGESVKVPLGELKGWMENIN
jgi:threonyl-tRNA synthetase